MQIKKERLKAIILEEIAKMQEAGLSKTVGGEAGLQQFYANNDLDQDKDSAFIRAMHKNASNTPKRKRSFEEDLYNAYDFLIARGLYDEMMYPDGSKSGKPEPGTGDPEAARKALTQTPADPKVIDYVIDRL